jgi:hypothetical protein
MQTQAGYVSRKRGVSMLCLGASRATLLASSGVPRRGVLLVSSRLFCRLLSSPLCPLLRHQPPPLRSPSTQYGTCLDPPAQSLPLPPLNRIVRPSDPGARDTGDFFSVVLDSFRSSRFLTIPLSEFRRIFS